MGNEVLTHGRCFWPYIQTNQQMEFRNSIKRRPDLAKSESLRGINSYWCWTQGMREWSIITSNNHPSNPQSHPFPTFSTSKYLALEPSINGLIKKGQSIQLTPNWLGKTRIFPVDFPPTECIYDYPLVICYIAIENGHRNRWFTHWKW